MLSREILFLLTAIDLQIDPLFRRLFGEKVLEDGNRGNVVRLETSLLFPRNHFEAKRFLPG